MLNVFRYWMFTRKLKGYSFWKIRNPGTLVRIIADLEITTHSPWLHFSRNLDGRRVLWNHLKLCLLGDFLNHGLKIENVYFKYAACFQHARNF